MHPHVQKNLDKFKATFQKPSQIYRFLRGRWKNHPLFLNRTLSYVSKHRDRKIRQRDTSIDKIANRLGREGIKRENNKVICKRQHKSNSLLNGDDTCTELKGVAVKEENSGAGDGQVCCYFNWICDDSSKTNQKTKSFGYVCPWCENDSKHLDTFMMHLKCCHSRFNYNLVEENSYPVIEMTLNLSYDGSYCGFKFPGHDLRRDFRFTPKSPHRRQTQTLFTYFKSKRLSNNLTHIETYPDHLDAEIFYDDGEADVDVCSGRLYYHTSTCLPVKPNEGDIDSEADMDPEWLKERTQLMIDEFTDVNEGEKEILKLWNLHMMRNYKYRADNMIRQACLDFVQMEGAKILSKNLTKNFTLHLANLYDFGLIGSMDIIECIRMLRKMRQPPQLITTSPTRAANKIRQEHRNEHCQHSPPAKRALLNSQCNQ